MPPLSDVPLRSLTASRVLVVAGKGGVGKTTVTAVIARAAARGGRKVLAVELDGKPMLAKLLKGSAVEVISISAPDALDEYLREHGFARLAKRLNKSGVIDLVGTATPGIDDVVVLGKIKQLERSGDYDLIVVDGPAAGHAITFLTSASGLASSVRGGPVRAQSDDVLELLHDAERCQVVLVTLPETTPVNEVVETAFALEEDVGVQLGPLIVNGVDKGGAVPDPADAESALDAVESSDETDALRAAYEFVCSRREMERDEIARLGDELPLPRIVLPLLPSAGLLPGDLDRLVDALGAVDV
ncbi:MAG: ArsA family ATPase [Acidimicrobiia bacterium]|nr:ArsA family ATPase [Acidimicrobiia bacterium]